MKPSPYPIPRDKKVRVILDTDCYCEADDQFAVAHALMTPKFDVVGICAEHYADRFGPGSEQASYEECLRILELMGLSGSVPVFHGCAGALPDEKTPRPSPAAEFIIREALRDDPRPLFITGQGALSNVASAWLMEPAIAGRFTLVWIGGGSYPDGESEFNVENDLHAANAVLASPIEVWQVPKNLYSSMIVPFSVLWEKVAPCGALGQHLVGNLNRVNELFTAMIQRPGCTPGALAASYPGGEMWILGDSPAIGLILFDQRYSFETRPAPRIAPDCSYLPGDDPARIIRVYTAIDRDFTLDDFYPKLRYHFG